MPPTQTEQPQPRAIRYVRLSDVRPAESNPRVHDLPSLKFMIDSLGFFDAIIEDLRTGRMVAGHGRIEALVEMRAEGFPLPDGLLLDDDGEWLLPVQTGWASRDDAEATVALVGHNRINENARWNDYGLAELIESIATETPQMLDAAGVDENFLEDLLRHVNPERLGEQDPDQPERPAKDDTDNAERDGGDDTDDDTAPDERGDRDNILCPACGHYFPRRV